MPARRERGLVGSVIVFHVRCFLSICRYKEKQLDFGLSNKFFLHFSETMRLVYILNNVSVIRTTAFAKVTLGSMPDMLPLGYHI